MVLCRVQELGQHNFERECAGISPSDEELTIRISENKFFSNANRRTFDRRAHFILHVAADYISQIRKSIVAV